MNPAYNYLYFPLALSHIGAGDISAAKECLQIALHNPLSPKQVQHLATTSAHWAMSRARETRSADVEALLLALSEMRLQQDSLTHRIVNQVHHTWAFEAYTLREWPEVGRQVMDTMATNPALIRNRGLLSILVRSTLERIGFAAAPGTLEIVAPGDQVHHEASTRGRVEALLGTPVRDWQKIDAFTPITPRHYLYVFSDAHGRWVAKQAVRGSVIPPAQLMQQVLQAGVPAPACRIEQLGSPQTPGLRIETFIEGSSLNPNQVAPREMTGLVSQLGEVMQRMHTIPVQGFGLLAADPGAHCVSPDWLRDQLDLETLKALLWLDESIKAQQRVELTAHALTMLDDCPYTEPAVFCHGDLNPGNILVHKDKLAGLIDWEFLQGSDPAYDCAYFLMCTCSYWYPDNGRAFMEQVIEAFLGNVTPDLLKRVSAYVLLCMLQEWNLAVLFSGDQPWRDPDKIRSVLMMQTPEAMWT